jgi:hypothetical protein
MATNFAGASESIRRTTLLRSIVCQSVGAKYNPLTARPSQKHLAEQPQLLVDKLQLDTCSDYFQTATSKGNVKVCSKHCRLT